MLINSQLCPGVQGMDVIREINARACGLLISDLCNFQDRVDIYASLQTICTRLLF